MSKEKYHKNALPNYRSSELYLLKCETHFFFRWRKKSTPTESSSLLLFTKSWTKSRSHWMKVCKIKIPCNSPASSSSSLLWTALARHHCNLVHLLQMTRPTSTRLSAPTHRSHVSPIWWSWRRNGLPTRMRSTSQDYWPVIPGCFPACRSETTVKMRAMPGCWSDLQNSKRE